MTPRYFALAWLALAACGPVDINVIHLPPGSQFDGGMGHPCTETSDCPGDQFCERLACRDALGHCAPRPPSSSVCPGNYLPECGCNGVTYWNGCLRRAAGEARDAQECTRTCDGANACPDGTFCARLVSLPTDCARAAAGSCWSLPLNCEAGPAGHRVTCDNSACLDLCGAIRSGQPSFEQSGSCP